MPKSDDKLHMKMPCNESMLNDNNIVRSVLGKKNCDNRPFL